MRELESLYWDEQAEKRTVKAISDNIWKRAAIAHRLYAFDWFERRILEIGVGFGSIAATLRLIYLDHINYIGTDVSPIFCKKSREFFNLDVVNTDVTNLPETEGGFNRVIALDTLEHVHPDDRNAGYQCINKVMAEDATMFINMPFTETQHDLDFDHPLMLSDINRLCDLANLEMVTFERYTVYIPNRDEHRPYGWIVLKRGNGG
jgi:2-polyprenyl-3-methyl-5-hydroxy-6-metoxy-1,4-benzoquinol methylase